MTLNRRRGAVEMLQDRFGVSERRACRVTGQHRSTQRHEPPPPPTDEAVIRAELRAFAKRRPRWGWRRAAIDFRKQGWRINHKRVRRLWREEGQSVPVRRKRKRLTGIGAHVGPVSLIALIALWALDFQFDHTIDHREVKLLNVMDHHTYEALAIRVEHSIGADDVVATLDRLLIERGGPPAFACLDIDSVSFTYISIGQQRVSDLNRDHVRRTPIVEGPVSTNSCGDS